MSAGPWPELYRWSCETCGEGGPAANVATALERQAEHELERHPELRRRRVESLVKRFGVDRVFGITDEEREAFG